MYYILMRKSIIDFENQEDNAIHLYKFKAPYQNSHINLANIIENL